MNSKPCSFSTFLLVAALGPVVLPAHAARPAYPPPFSKVDKDQDEHIDRWEARAVRWLPEYFKTLDQDRDDRLSPDEYENLKYVAPRGSARNRPLPTTPPAPTPTKP